MSNLDQIVKGAPPPGNQYSVPSTSPILSTESSNASTLPDPLASLPSSPPQIYLNLLILEASLRAQWLQLRTRKRQHKFFLGLLAIWTIYFGYALFLKPREDGNGVGGSIYWVVEVTEKVCFMGGIVTAILVWGTGQWERGIRWPRRWVRLTNKGLRGFNCKLVVISRPWWRDLLSFMGFIFSYGPWSGSSGSSYRFVDHSLLIESEKTQRSGGHHALPNIHEDDDLTGYEEDLAPGGDYIKLLLLPKPFSPGFRENWDIYRTEYWEKENERRAILRQKLTDRDRKIAKKEGGWLWWTGYHSWKRGKAQDLEKTHHSTHKHGMHEKDVKRTRSGSGHVRSGSHSRNSSRSSTPTLELEEGSAGGHVRRGSNASSASDRRRKKTLPGTRGQKLVPSSPRSATPEIHSPLVRESSVSSQENNERSGMGDGDSAGNLRASAKTGGSSTRRPSSARATKQT